MNPVGFPPLSLDAVRIPLFLDFHLLYWALGAIIFIFMNSLLSSECSFYTGPSYLFALSITYNFLSFLMLPDISFL